MEINDYLGDDTVSEKVSTLSKEKEYEIRT
jgi:hypothetical protein